MGEPIRWKYDISPHFRVAGCMNVRRGDYHELPAAPDATPVEGSETLVACPEIMVVTKGAFDLQIPGLGTMTLRAGDISLDTRFPGAIRIEAALDDSAYTCLTPRRGRFWQRQGGFLAAGEAMTVDLPPNEMAYLYVALGGLVLDASGAGHVGSFRPLAAGEHEVVAEQTTRFVLLWR